VRERRAEFGKELTELRSGKGVSLDEMASAIKVRRELLKALEEGRFEALPPTVFVEGYLKAFAHHLETEPTPLLARYRSLCGGAPQPKAPPVVAPPVEDESGGAGWLKWILLVLVLAVAGYGAYYLTGRMEPDGNAEAPARLAAHPREPDVPATVQQEAQAAPQENPPPNEPSAGEAIAQQVPEGGEAVPQEGLPAGPAAAVPDAAPKPAEPTTQPPPAAPAGDLVLTASGPCWCEIWSDGRRVLYKNVSSGERLAFDGSTFRVSLGNAGGVELVYKGQRVPLPQGQGTVVKDLTIPGPSGGSAP
jgi:cytoskeleton protein RodZ